MGTFRGSPGGYGALQLGHLSHLPTCVEKTRDRLAFIGARMSLALPGPKSVILWYAVGDQQLCTKKQVSIW